MLGMYGRKGIKGTQLLNGLIEVKLWMIIYCFMWSVHISTYLV